MPQLNNATYPKHPDKDEPVSYLLLFLSTAVQVTFVHGTGNPPSHVTVKRIALSSIMDGPSDSPIFFPGLPVDKELQHCVNDIHDITDKLL